jgi:hypothetical protein
MAIRVAVVLVVALAACKSKAMDKEDRCHDVVEHVRKVTKMPMREGDVSMMMGACAMWMDDTLACLEKARNDEDIERCNRNAK